jgi:DNA topoisomerase-2
MFNSADLDVLPRHRVDGELAEPKLLMPLLPMALVNGAAGIATGFSTNIWPHAPTDLIAATTAILDNRAVGKLVPSFRCWDGNVSVFDGGFSTTGKHTVLGDVSIKVKTLPVGVFPNAFQSKLQKLKGKGMVKNFDISYLESGPQFAVTFTNKTSGAAMCKNLGLVKTHSTKNLHLLDKTGVLKKYANTEAILQEYVELKLQITGRRIKHQIRAVQEELAQLGAVQRFIQLFLDGNIVFKAKSASEIDAQLSTHALLEHKQKLLSLPIRRLTQIEIEKAAAKQRSLEKTLAALQTTTPKKTYKRELKLLHDFIKPSKKRKSNDGNKHAKKCKK